MDINTCQAASTEDAGVAALSAAKRKLVDHVGNASKELGSIAAQYGRLIDGYKKEIDQIDSAFAKLRGGYGVAGSAPLSPPPFPGGVVLTK